MIQSLHAFSASLPFLLLWIVLLLGSRKFPFLKRSSRILALIVLIQLTWDGAKFCHYALPSLFLKVTDFVFIFLLVSFGIYLSKDFILSWLNRKGVSVSKIFWDVMIAILYTVLVLFLLKEIFNIDITPLLATSAVLTVVIGLALQDILINLIAGTVFHFEDSVKLGDWVEVDGKVGQVHELSWRSTTLLSPERDQMIFPNQEFTRKPFTNLSRSMAARQDLIGLSYHDDPDVAISVMRKAILSTPGVAPVPEPGVYIKSFDDFAINYRIRYYIQSYQGFRQLEGDVRRNIWYALKRSHLSIPYPVRTLQIERPAREPDGSAERRGIQEILAGQEMFRDLSPDELEAIARFSELQEYPAGYVLALEGEEGTAMFVITRGSVDVTKNGRKLATLCCNDVVGEMSLFTGEKRGANLTAATQLQVLVIHKAGFDSILRQNQDFIDKIEKMVDQRLSASTEMASTEQQENRRNILSRIRKYLLWQ